MSLNKAHSLGAIISAWQEDGWIVDDRWLFGLLLFADDILLLFMDDIVMLSHTPPHLRHLLGWLKSFLQHLLEVSQCG